MSLAASLQTFKTDSAAAASRNAQYARPGQGGASSSARPANSTPSSAAQSSEKRSHDAAFSAPAGSTGTELMTQVVFAIKYLNEKRVPVIADDLIRYLNIPNDSQRNIPHIKTALRAHERVQVLSTSDASTGPEAFKYKPIHPVTNVDELRSYLSGWSLAQGISVKELKDGFQDCYTAITELENSGELLVTRNKKDGSPRMIWPDRPEWHAPIDQAFKDYWMKCKLPNEIDMRTELERGGITPTSHVKLLEKKVGKKEKRKVQRRGGKTTNSHMAGILKDYNGRR